MLKKTIKFKDLDGNQLEEDFYFNLSKAELAELEIGEAKYGGMSAIIEKIIAETDGKKIVELLNEIIKASYGVRSSDNRRFIKNQEVWEDFLYSDARDELLYELYTDPTAASEFMKGVAPSEVADKIAVDGDLSPEELRKKAIEAMQGHKSKES